MASKTKARRISMGMAWALGWGGLASGAVPASAWAMSQDTRTVLRAGAYGIVGGTALGLVSLPFNGEARTVFMGSSLGLYLGLAAGIYAICRQEDAEPPQASRPVDRDRTRWVSGRGSSPADALAEAEDRSALRLSVTVLRF